MTETREKRRPAANIERLLQDVEVLDEVGWSGETEDLLSRIALLVEEEKDLAMCVSVLQKLEQQADRPRAAAEIERLSALTAGFSTTFLEDLGAEVRAARRLLDAGLLRRGDHKEVLRAINASATQDSSTPLSVVRHLEEVMPQDLMNALTFMARDAKVPLLPLVRFEAQEAAARSLADLRDRSILAFDHLGESLMVAVLNPYNRGAQERAIALAGRPCLFYLVLASDFDQALRRFSWHTVA